MTFHPGFKSYLSGQRGGDDWKQRLTQSTLRPAVQGRIWQLQRTVILSLARFSECNKSSSSTSLTYELQSPTVCPHRAASQVSELRFFPPASRATAPRDMFWANSFQCAQTYLKHHRFPRFLGPAGRVIALSSGLPYPLACISDKAFTTAPYFTCWLTIVPSVE